MKKLLLLLCLAAAGYMGQAQKSLYSELPGDALGRYNASEDRVLQQFRNNPMVTGIRFINVDLSVLREDMIAVSAPSFAGVAKRLRREVHDEDDGLSWFGRLGDETGIFFTAMNGQLASKFYAGNVPCLIIPFRGTVHLLITYSHDIDDGVCGAPHGNGPKTGAAAFKAAAAPPIAAAAFSADDNCTMRILWVVTGQAEPEIPMSLELAARMLQDESNLAYAQSTINYRMEIARVVRTTYTETTNNTTATAYGVTSSYPSDLINLSTGAGLLNNIPVLRDLYRADVVVMVRSLATNQAQGFYGVAYGVPTDPSALNADNAFALISTEYMIGGRFTFAHEIGHIQGARHDNHNANPVYARGYVFSTAANDNRTIMAVGGSCNPPTGCRVQFFSTPNATYGGIPVGIANDRDNARRINETGPQVLAFRLTQTSLLLGAETFDNEILARHLATQTISTNNSAVVAQPGSRVSMRAGNSVTLLPGFAANAGSVFNAYINTCTYVPTTDRTQTAAGAPVTAAPQAEMITAGRGIILWPNPANNMLHIALANRAERITAVRLFSSTGERMALKTPAGSQTLDVSALTGGVYFLEVHTNSGNYRARFMKQ